MARPLALRKVRRFRAFDARKVIECLRQGMTAEAIGKLDGMPCAATIFRWAVMAVPTEGWQAKLGPAVRQYQQEFAVVKEQMIEQCIHEALPIADTAFESGDAKMCLAEVARNKLRVETRLKLPALVKPGTYGPKVLPTQVDQSVVFQTINYYQGPPVAQIESPVVEVVPA